MARYSAAPNRLLTGSVLLSGNLRPFPFHQIASAELEQAAPEKIECIDVLKGDEALAKYTDAIRRLPAQATERANLMSVTSLLGSIRSRKSIP